MKQKYQLKHETKNQQTNKQTQNKPEKGTQIDGTTGEATPIAPETDPSEDSVK